MEIIINSLIKFALKNPDLKLLKLDLQGNRLKDSPMIMQILKFVEKIFEICPAVEIKELRLGGV